MSLFGTDRQPPSPSRKPRQDRGPVPPGGSNLDANALEEMLSALPEAPEAAPASPDGGATLDSWLQDMQVALPDNSEPAPPSAPTADFQERRRVPGSPPVAQQAARSASGSSPSAPVNSARRQATAAAPASRREPAAGPAPARAASVPDSEPSDAAVAGFLAEASESTPSRASSGSTSRGTGSGSGEFVGFDSDDDLKFRIERELQKYAAAAAANVQVAVHDGVATLIGEVAGDYEKQLAVHFTKAVKGVSQVVDLLRVANARSATAPAPVAASAAPRPAVRKGPARVRSEWSLPFRPTYIGLAAGLLAIIWVGYSFGSRDPSRIEVHPVAGKLVLAGTDLGGALVSFHPQSPSNPARPKATVKPDGSFELMTYAPADGAPEGDYKVTIVLNRLIEVDGEMTAGPNLLPPALSKPESTTINVSVKPGKNELPPFQIQP